ncbi:MAG: proline--tRNA ligase [Eggerthellaceae bacterium]|nr:proline--tRNA ligase [Eggerthellaceae bacterium]
MTRITRMSELYAPTLKEVPTDAAIASHQLLLRAGMMRKSATGMYTFLPLGLRVIAKIEKIVREEMDAIGAQEILMPMVQPADLWHESGRWDDYGPELMRLEDRHGVQMCLGPTHEEIITALVRNELRSYKQLPTTLYQIQDKLRDERRPRFGLMRSREFIMKDAYSFHSSYEDLHKTYQEMSDAYARICERLGLDYRPVDADSGQIGGSVTCEYHALADSGEADLVSCECGFAANTEVAKCVPHPTEFPETELRKVYTPGVHTISELAEFLNCPESSTVKAMVGKTDEGEIVALFLPGDHELGELKADRAVGGFCLLHDDEIRDAGLPKGSIGCVGLPEGMRIVADQSLRDVKHWVVGANEDGYHFVGAEQGRDFTVDEWADLSTAMAGDGCPECGKSLTASRGIEVGQVFELGDKYSVAMGATYSDENGKEQPFIMGCYGVGISRCMGAVVEQYNDEYGIKWPLSVAPAHVCVLPLQVGDDLVQPTAERIARELAELGVEVVIDDRKERPGVKFAEADLMGWPVQIVVGKRGLQAGTLEVKNRHTNEKTSISLDEYAEALSFARRSVGSPDSVRTFLEQIASLHDTTA